MKNLYELTAHEIREMYDKKETTVPEVTKAFLDRIKEVDGDIKAYITVCEEEAMKKAKEVQALFDKGEKLGALAGIPIGIKDNICTKGVKTTCASKMLENFVAPYNATVIEKLNEEHAIILGKLNMDEFAMGGSTENSAFFKTTIRIITSISRPAVRPYPARKPCSLSVSAPHQRMTLAV